MPSRRRIFTWTLLVLGLGCLPRVALAINLEYKLHVPPYSLGFEHILTVDPAPATLLDDGGDPAAISKFNSWRLAPPSLGKLDANSSIASDILAPGGGLVDEFHVVSPAAGGLYKLVGMNGPGGLYDGENSAFSGAGVGVGPGAVARAVWDIEILSTGEPIGTPVKVDVRAIIQGYLDANMATHLTIDDARASWNVEAEGGTVISGTASLIDGPGTVPFSEDNLLSPVTFFKAVGDTFTVMFDYKLEVDGTAPFAVSTAEVTGSEIVVTATVVPEPCSMGLALVGLGGLVSMAMRKRRLRSSRN